MQTEGNMKCILCYHTQAKLICVSITQAYLSKAVVYKKIQGAQRLLTMEFWVPSPHMEKGVIPVTRRQKLLTCGTQTQHC